MFNLISADVMEGHDFEAYIAKMFRVLGFIATVTRGSGDQGVDIIVAAGNNKYAVQTKCFKNLLSNKPIQEIFAGAMHYKCKNAVVITNAGYTEGAKELAISTGVEIWDYKKLEIAFNIANEVEVLYDVEEETAYNTIQTSSLFARYVLESFKYDKELAKKYGAKLYKSTDTGEIYCYIDGDTTLPIINVGKLVKEVQAYFNKSIDEPSEALVNTIKCELDDENIDEEIVSEALRGICNRGARNIITEDQMSESDLDKIRSIEYELIDATIEAIDEVIEDGVEIHARSTKYYVDVYASYNCNTYSLIKAYKSGYGGRPFSFSISGYDGEEAVGNRRAINRKDVASGIDEFKEFVKVAYLSALEKIM